MIVAKLSTVEEVTKGRHAACEHDLGENTQLHRRLVGRRQGALLLTFEAKPDW
jgi:hypothetical protein